MGRTVAECSAIAVGILVVSCVPSDSPSTPLEPSTLSLTAQSVNEPPAIPAWITDPLVLPAGLRGRNNCTFAFGQVVPQWDFHSDAGCWERPGPDGWTRQQQYRIHVPQLALCGGGPGDVSPIRVCRAPGLANPCPINPTTGPNGCAICVRSFICH